MEINTDTIEEADDIILSPSEMSKVVSAIEQHLRKQFGNAAFKENDGIPQE